MGFSTKIKIDHFNEGDEIAVFASAKLDQFWATQPDKMKPNVPPQSHFVNARTNKYWTHKRGDQIIEGKIEWFSIPVTIVIGPKGSELQELSERLPAGMFSIANAVEEEL